jgi:hypothetical protein
MPKFHQHLPKTQTDTPTESHCRVLGPLRTMQLEFEIYDKYCPGHFYKQQLVLNASLDCDI